MISIAIKLCISLGLHRKAAPSRLHLAVQLDSRLFWSCYILDRELTIAVGRPPSISDHDIDVPVRLPNTIFQISSSSNVVTASLGCRRGQHGTGEFSQGPRSGSICLGTSADNHVILFANAKNAADPVRDTTYSIPGRQGRRGASRGVGRFPGTSRSLASEHARSAIGNETGRIADGIHQLCPVASE